MDVPVAGKDAITCTITNTRKAKIVVEKHTIPVDMAAYKAEFGFTMDPGAIAYSLTDGGSDTRTVEPGRTYTITEADPHAKGYKLTAIDCTSGGGDVPKRTATVTPAAGESVTCSYTNAKLQPAIKIVKSGPDRAYSGDTLHFGFDVTNTGERPLTDVAVRGDERRHRAGRRRRGHQGRGRRLGSRQPTSTSPDAKCNAAPALKSSRRRTPLRRRPWPV